MYFNELLQLPHVKDFPVVCVSGLAGGQNALGKIVFTIFLNSHFGFALM
jgi:hypothetical protein